MSSVAHTTIKTIGYRAISWLSTTVLAWIIIGSQLSSGEYSATFMAELTLLFSVIDMFANTLLYFLYERLWIKHHPKIERIHIHVRNKLSRNSYE